MTAAHWALILCLAAGSYGLRLAGYLAGGRIRANPRVARMLDDLPGLIVVSLVAAAMGREGPAGWAAAAVALAAALLSRNVVLTMAAGLAAYAGIALVTG